MARIRTIKPTFWGDERVSRTPRDARLLMIGLMSMADDEGRFLASFQAIAGFVYPNDSDITPRKVASWLDELVRVGLVDLYTVGHIQYGHLIGFTRHQRINRPSPSTHPPPPTSERLREDSVNAY